MNKIEKTICATAGAGVLCAAAALAFLSNYADQNTTTQNFKRGDAVFLTDGSYKEKSAIVKEVHGGNSYDFKGVYNVMVDTDNDGEPDTLLLTKGAYMTKIPKISAPAPSQ